MGIIYNGSHSDDYNLVVDTKAAILPPIELITQEVPGKPGAYLFGKKFGMRAFVFPVGFVYKDGRDYHERLRDLAAWLDTGDEEKELILDNEPDKIYFAVVSELTDIDRIARTGQGTITFICPDPFAYGPTRSQLIHDPGGDPEMNPIIENNGTEATYPTFRATVLEPITFLNIVSPDDYMRIGRPVEVEEEPFEQYETILKDDCSTLVGWSTRTAGEALFGAGIVGGKMKVHDGWAFTPETYGENPNGWVGPAIQKSLAEPLQDFRVTIDISLRNVPRGCGKVVLFLIDEAGEPVGYLSMMDTTSSYPMARGVVQVAGEPGHHIINYTGDVPGVWNDFRGILRLERVGQQFTAHIAEVRQDGTHHARHTRHFTDADGRFQRKVASIVVYIAKAKHYDTFFQSMNDISVWKINNPADYQVPYIAEAGDEIVFDHKQNLITRNGEPILWSKDFGARFFPIHPGQTEIAVQPADSLIVNAQWNEVYK